jgi:hypothetical protein
MKANINSPIWNLTPILGFLLLAITEGKQYWIAGFCTVGWLTILGFRWLLNQEPKKG